MGEAWLLLCGQVMRIEAAEQKGSSSTEGRAATVLWVVSLMGLTLTVIAG